MNFAPPQKSEAPRDRRGSRSLLQQRRKPRLLATPQARTKGDFSCKRIP